MIKASKIRIEQSTGKKDRYTLLLLKALEMLRKYYIQYKLIDYLFEGQYTPMYSARSIQLLSVHESSKTTEIYIHLTVKGFDRIKSPPDTLEI